MALRGLLSPSFNPPEIPTGLYMLIWELPTSCRMADLPALLHLLGGTWSCLCSKASSASTQQTWRVWQEWRWWPTTVMMVMCSICFERVSYFFSPLSLHLPSVHLAHSSARSQSSHSRPSITWWPMKKRKSEWVSEWLPNRMFSCNYHFEATVPSVFCCLWVTLTKQRPKLLFKPYTHWSSNIILLLVLPLLEEHTSALFSFSLSTMFNKSSFFFRSFYLIMLVTMYIFSFNKLAGTRHELQLWAKSSIVFSIISPKWIHTIRHYFNEITGSAKFALTLDYGI